MSTNLTSIRTFLGKYYPEILYSASQDKYKSSKLDLLFEQRFQIQNNKVQMIIDPSMVGLSAIVSGNEIQVSQELYDHPSIAVTNSLENKDNPSNPKSLYNPEIFSTIAYLMCQNHTMFKITGEVDEPIYLKYKSEFESFYSSVIVVEINPNISVEIVEEIESLGALNSVVNYILHPSADLKLASFYNNSKSASSFVYRNIMALENATVKHTLLGKGSSNIIDEGKLMAANGTKSEFFGIVNSNSQNFHTVLSVYPENKNYRVNVDYRDILYGKADVTFFPVIVGQDSTEGSTISVSNITLEEIPEPELKSSISNYTKDIVDTMILERMVGVTRYYDNKAKALSIP